MLDSAPASVRVSSRLSAAVGSPARSRRLSPLTPTSASSSAENATAASASSQPQPAVAPPSPIAATASTAAVPTPPRSPTSLAAQQNVPSSFWAAVFRKSDAEAAEPESRFSFSERVADWVSENIGSWTFILFLLVFLVAWFVLNLVLEPAQQWDPFPFILVNLLLSFIAAYAHLGALIVPVVVLCMIPIVSATSRFRSYTAPIIMMSQNRSAQLDRVRDSSLHEKVDHMRLSQLLQLWETMQAQADDMQTLLRRWLQIQRVLRRGRGGTVNAQEWARVQMLQQASAFNTATHASGLATDSASAVPLQVAGGGCGALVSSQPCCPTCAAPWRSAASPPPWTTTTTTTTMTDGSADSASLFAARHTSNIAHISGGNASGGAGGNDEEHLDTQLDALQSSIEVMRLKLASHAGFDLNAEVSDAAAEAMPDLELDVAAVSSPSSSSAFLAATTRTMTAQNQSNAATLVATPSVQSSSSSSSNSSYFVFLSPTSPASPQSNCSPAAAAASALSSSSSSAASSAPAPGRTLSVSADLGTDDDENDDAHAVARFAIQHPMTNGEDGFQQLQATAASSTAAAAAARRRRQMQRKRRRANSAAAAAAAASSGTGAASAPGSETAGSAGVELSMVSFGSGDESGSHKNNNNNSSSNGSNSNLASYSSNVCVDDDEDRDDDAEEAALSCGERCELGWTACWHACLFRGHFVNESMTFGERLADIVSQRVGSWTFVISQTSILCVWLVLNSVLGKSAWDPQPFVLLNLCLSAQAAFTAPIIMMAQNRQGDADRVRARDLHIKVDHVRLAQIFALGDALQLQQHLLGRMGALAGKVEHAAVAVAGGAASAAVATGAGLGAAAPTLAAAVETSTGAIDALK